MSIEEYCLKLFEETCNNDNTIEQDKIQDLLLKI